MDVYTHDSYTLVRATAMMREAVAHLLTREIPEDLARELQSWRRPGQGKGEGHVQDVEEEPIPFQLVKRIHEQLQKMPMGGSLGGHLLHWVPNYGMDVHLLQRGPRTQKCFLHDASGQKPETGKA